MKNMKNHLLSHSSSYLTLLSNPSLPNTLKHIPLNPLNNIDPFAHLIDLLLQPFNLNHTVVFLIHFLQFALLIHLQLAENMRDMFELAQF
jgi:hypothetical protein